MGRLIINRLVVEFCCWFVCIDDLCLSQQFFGQVETEPRCKILIQKTKRSLIKPATPRHFVY